MRIRRDLLASGLFLIPIGAITLLVRSGAIGTDALRDAPRLWPLVLVGLGLAILLGRSRAASLGTATVALVAGAIVGSAIASGPVWIGGVTECGPVAGATQHVDRSGTFGGPADVDLQLRCGSVALSTRPGADWAVAGDFQGPAPEISDAADRLAIRVPAGPGVRHHDWTIKAPPERLRSVALTSNAATGSLVLDGATLSAVRVEANAGDFVIDAGRATVGRLDVELNAGRARITLGNGPTVGRLEVNAGALDVCVAPGASVRLTVKEQLTFITNLADRGFQRSGEAWVRNGSSAGPSIDLQIEGNAAGLTIDPTGGCR